MSLRERAVCLLVVVAFLAGPFLGHMHKSLRTHHGDWLSIYNIALHSVKTGRLQADERENIVRTQRYPPITRPLLMLFALSPKTVSAVLSFFFFAGLYGWCAWRLAEMFLATSSPGTWTGAMLLVGFVGPYVWADLTAGNLTSILLWSVTAAFVLAQRGRPIRAGVALSIGIMLKMIPAICLVYFLSRRQWRVLYGVIMGVVMLGVIPAMIIFGPQQLWDYHGYWFREEFVKFTPLTTIDKPVECLYQNQAVVRTMVRLFTHTNAGHSTDSFYIQIAEPPRWVLKVAYVAIMGVSVSALLAVLWHSRKNASLRAAGGCYALCVGSMLWLSPWAASYYFSLAMWPAAWLVSEATRSADDRTSRAVRITLVAWVVLMGSLASQSLRALGLTMWGAMLLLIVMGRRLWWDGEAVRADGIAKK